MLPVGVVGGWGSLWGAGVLRCGRGGGSAVGSSGEGDGALGRAGVWGGWWEGGCNPADGHREADELGVMED